MTTVYARWPAILALFALCLSCASGGSNTRERRGARASSSLVPIVTAADLADEGRHDTLLNALRRYRPLFLGSRGSVPIITIDGSPLQDLSFLDNVRVSEVAEVRLLRAPSAFSGDRNVLFVRTRIAH